MARQSDINDLTKEKVITAIFLYEYEESDESGTNIMPITERHIVNIHLQFKSGVPQIGQLSKPNTVLPGSTVGMKVPEVTTGAFEVLSSGWEVFANKEDAAAHKNGTPFVNNNTPVYWYQDDYQIAYYTKTYLGKTYSNYVPLSVGNYHDIANVMADTNNHMFIDHPDAQKYNRGPKIYLDNRNTTGVNTDKSELDMLKDLFDLSLYPKYDEHGEVLPAINGHNRLDEKQIGAAKNLEFFLQDDLAPKAYTTWQPIGTASQCFEGTLHGDGYTISGLNHSLFENLCGEVYNLGVTGTFTEAGIVNTGSGYVENCWVKSDATTVDGSVKAVFGNPTDTKGTQLVNCYYPETNAYSETEHARGNARKKPLKAFYNGEVTYDLNGFYLNKRYYDHSDATGYAYSYLDTKELDADNKPMVKDEQYAVTDHFDYKYISERYSNVDFTFAGGTVPTTDDIRLVVDTENNRSYYSPLWPDDYLFFGQRLTYGYVDGRPHQETPSYIHKSGGRLQTDRTNSNRVFRAPAYYQNSVMHMVHYNPYAIFADHKKGDDTQLIHHNMTAVDFTGSNGDVDGGYKEGVQSSGLFFPPMLDNDGLEGLQNIGLTKNWLVYTPDAVSGNATAGESKTNSVVLDYLKEYALSTNITNATYRSVAAQDKEHQIIHGHAVVKTGANSFTSPADRDHYLVDKQDFNAPIEYNIAKGHYMWYQRTPDTYVDRTKGWEGISLPFSVELVATNQKGEITHFYGGSRSSYNETGTKYGHEYWLREFKGKVKVSTDPEVYNGDFGYPTTQPDWAVGVDKSYTNTFLWNYYYREASAARPDKNTDIYQQDYYKEPRTYVDYAYAAAAKPYIIGFPGTTYYEFDLSGGWKASNSHSEIDELGQQTITFASHESTDSQPVTIAVSDTEMVDAAVTYDGYTFRPNYLTKEVAAGAYVLNSNTYTAVANGTTLTSGKTYYTSDAGAGQFTSAGTEVADGTNYFELTAAAGSSYDVTATATAGVPFRPYFTKASSGVKGNNQGGAKHITFNRLDSQLGNDEEQTQPSDRLDGELIIKGKRGRIIVTSAYNSNVTVHIVNAAGALIRTFTLAPGETVETNVAAGVYIVNKTKISIR